MSVSGLSGSPLQERLWGFATWGVFWFLVACVAAGIFFSNGINALLTAWQLPEYSHGPLIPVLSGLLFLRQLKDVPVDLSSPRNRWPGVILVAFSIAFGALGILANIDDIVAYALILWVGGILLVSWGWNTGKHFWPGVVHLVYMLPLPGVIYFKTTTYLQFVSSELGVWFLRLMDVPVFLEGNIIDLGVVKLHVAEACSGLRYMFPIMSFSYIFATLYRGPVWHKLTLLLAAVPIAIVMNSVRIAVAGIIVQRYGNEWLEGFTHFFEGWVIFLACIFILFGLAWLMLFLRRDKMSLVEALDLDTTGLGTQALRLRFVQPSRALILSAVLCIGAVAALQSLPERGSLQPARDSFALFPRTLGDWRQDGPREFLAPGIERVLSADDYHQVTLTNTGHGGTREPVHGLVLRPVQERGAFPRGLPAGRRLGNRLARAQRHDAGDAVRHAVQDQPRDHPEGRDPDDGLLLVPAAPAQDRLGFRRQVLADDGRHHDRAHRRGAGASDHADRPE